MIHEATEELAGRTEFSNPLKMDDGYGTIGYLLNGPNARFVIVAKEYAYQDLASFMARLVERADADDRFIFYCADDDSYTVFDGGYLKEHGNPSQGASKKRECSWVECPRSEGVVLDDYLAGVDQPTTVAGENTQLGQFA